MTAEIITIGDELLIGQVINTNQAYIAEQLNTVGIYCDRMTTVGDNENVILDSFTTAFERSDVVCVTGGLGPTHDDITKKVVSKFFKTELVMNNDVLAQIEVLAQRRNIAMIQSNIDQALVPKGCTIIPNSAGTAPGMMFEIGKKYFFVMPGVPYEMKGMMDEWIIPFFEKKNISSVVRHRSLKTTGIGESMLAKEIGNVDDVIGRDGTTTLAFLPNPMGTKLRITVKEKSIDSAQLKLNNAEQILRSKIGKYVYSSDEKDLEDVIGEFLTKHKMTLAVAESCTGGMISNRITNVPGASIYFLRGYVTYSNQAKSEELNVPKELISSHGAVSKEVAEAMAHGARVNAKTDIALSVTGTAGPTGGSPEKPVGLCWIGYSDKDITFAMKFNFGDNRLRFKERASQAALELLRRKLLKSE
ncbi:MAG: competence/damage-inducible protein A [Bacteroidota bacterium]|nr:competence/damage-inducible protein A [Bacteroidota bacterium]